MIEAQQFVSAAAARGFSFYAGVPCSYLTQLIDRLLVSPGITYISSANEGDAVATAAGAVLGGRSAVVFLQNSGLGNAVNPLASLNWAFGLPVLLVVGYRGDPQGSDEPQHRLMGEITGSLLELLKVPWEVLPTEPAKLEDALERASAFMKREGRPYALVVRKGSFAPEQAVPPQFWAPRRGAPRAGNGIPFAPGPLPRPSRGEALAHLMAATPPERCALIATTGYTGRELCALGDRANQFYMVGSMGCAASLGLGLALARPDLEVVVIDGDGALLMRMGSMATLGTYGASNLVHIVLDNEAHESTGGQHTVTSGVSFGTVAHACGYASAFEGDSLATLDAVLADARAALAPGPRFAQLKIRSGTPADLPRPEVSPAAVCTRFAAHIASASAGSHR